MTKRLTTRSMTKNLDVPDAMPRAGEEGVPLRENERGAEASERPTPPFGFWFRAKEDG